MAEAAAAAEVVESGLAESELDPGLVLVLGLELGELRLLLELDRG